MTTITEEATETVSIKPLEWVPDHIGGGLMSGEYRVRAGIWSHGYYWMRGEDGPHTGFPEEDDAKAAAQNDHEARIRSALVAPQAEGRDTRQQQVAQWCAAAFGAEHQASVPQRGLRFLEEAIEAYQALGGDQGQAHKLIDYIFAKEPGDLSQELGGVGITLLALAAAAGLSADQDEQAELDRVLSKPLSHFWERNKVKNEAGFDALAYPTREVTP